MKKKNFRDLLRDERGQLDILGNIIELLKTQPWILALLFLAIIYTGTLSYNLFCDTSKPTVDVVILGFAVDLPDSYCSSLNLADLVNNIVTPLFGAFGFGFDIRLFVVLCFLVFPVIFILRHWS